MNTRSNLSGCPIDPLRLMMIANEDEKLAYELVNRHMCQWEYGIKMSLKQYMSMPQKQHETFLISLFHLFIKIARINRDSILLDEAKYDKEYMVSHHRDAISYMMKEFHLSDDLEIVDFREKFRLTSFRICRKDRYKMALILAWKKGTMSILPRDIVKIIFFKFLNKK